MLGLLWLGLWLGLLLRDNSCKLDRQTSLRVGRHTTSQPCKELSNSRSWVLAGLGLNQALQEVGLNWLLWLHLLATDRREQCGEIQ